IIKDILSLPNVTEIALFVQNAATNFRKDSYSENTEKMFDLIMDGKYSSGVLDRIPRSIIDDYVTGKNKLRLIGEILFIFVEYSDESVRTELAHKLIKYLNNDQNVVALAKLFENIYLVSDPD